MSQSLKLVYLVGIALNAAVLVATALAGQWVVAGTFGLIIVYLSVRYWIIDSS